MLKRHGIKIWKCHNEESLIAQIRVLFALISRLIPFAKPKELVRPTVERTAWTASPPVRPHVTGGSARLVEGLQPLHLFQPSFVSWVARKPCQKKTPHQIASKLDSDNPRPEHEDVHIVVFDSLASRVCVVA